MRKRLPRLPDDVLPRLDVPVQRLSDADRQALLDYLRALSLSDRAAFFGHPLSDARVAAYAQRIDFSADAHFAARGAASLIIGVAHCRVIGGHGVVNVHVAHGYRRRGIGTALGAALTGFGRRRDLGRLRAYFDKADPIAAHLARALGMALKVGIDRFYAELPLVPDDAPA
ncbi:MAG: GNAT family N-acetyltransferase [Burkholderiales bacterium]|nr:GNAT family N-acetyltransferase [Burkholderiales bacterium]